MNQVRLVVSIVLLITAFANVSCVASGAQSEPTPQEESVDNSASSTEVIEKENEITHVLDVLGDITTKQGLYWKYVLVESELEEDEIIEIAAQLHALEPETWYHLMDSDSEFDAMLKALPETGEGNYTNWPAEYVENHFVGRIMQEIRPDGNGGTNRVWLAESGPAYDGQFAVPLE